MTHFHHHHYATTHARTTRSRALHTKRSPPFQPVRFAALCFHLRAVVQLNSCRSSHEHCRGHCHVTYKPKTKTSLSSHQQLQFHKESTSRHEVNNMTQKLRRPAGRLSPAAEFSHHLPDSSVSSAPTSSTTCACLRFMPLSSRASATSKRPCSLPFTRNNRLTLTWCFLSHVASSAHCSPATPLTLACPDLP